MNVMKRTLLAVITGLLIVACSRIENGVIVSKFSRVDATRYSGLGPVFGVDVQGPDKSGRIVRRSAFLSQEEWVGVNLGDDFSFAGRSLLFGAPRDKNEVPLERASVRQSHKKKSARNTSDQLSAQDETPVLNRLANMIHSTFSIEPKPSAEPAQPPASVSPAKTKRSTTTAKSRAPKAKTRTTTAKSRPPKKIQPAPAEAPSLTAEQLMDQYRDVQAQALESPEVRAAKQKIHAAANEQEQNAASHEYWRVLYEKMREIDSSLKERIDQEEAAKVPPAPQPAAQPATQGR